jgi:phage terminase small subunit
MGKTDSEIREIKSIPKPLPDVRQEAFCQILFGSKVTPTEAALQAKYSPKGATQTASRLLTYVNIRGRLQALQEQSASKKIMQVVERKERLSEFGRENITGKHGTVVRVGNIEAIRELNKMERIYDDRPKADTYNIQINVISPEARKLTDSILSGVRSLPTPAPQIGAGDP